MIVYFNVLQVKIFLKGSYVFIIGLVDGVVLYNLLSDRIYLIGLLWNDVIYFDFYDYFNCLEVYCQFVN